MNPSVIGVLRSFVMPRRLLTAVLIVPVPLTCVMKCSAQDAQSGRLIVTVVDASGAVLRKSRICLTTLRRWRSSCRILREATRRSGSTASLARRCRRRRGDRRHRYQIALNSQALKNLNASFTLRGNTGTPYPITTGFDDNNDSIFNDRPVGISRNSARTATQATATANLTYSIGLGTPTAAPRAQERQGGSERGSAASPSGRYRLVLTFAVNNLTNRSNFIGYSGIRTSPFFLEPTSVSNPRKIDVGIGLRF
jgi:hypothetical protein